ncbi:MAG: T9SS type A sorting domain-containing protein [Bacteroidetes bacterium]|jgi:hypothetical protein|nr:T9SS type A sorting domain-containing protein [Bacteroidota bacterium]
MKRITLLKILTIALFLVMGVGNAWGQVISQYVETDSGTTPKGIEIWNNTGAVLDFVTNNLVIEKGVNGGAPSTDFTLDAGSLAVGAVIVIGSSDMEATATGNGATFYEKPFTFNGDDALVVKYGGTTTDVFGNPGSDPGSDWSGNGVSTADQNIQLKSGITAGDTDGWTDPSERFETISIQPSTVGGLNGFGLSPTNDPSIQVSTSSLSNLDYAIGYGPSFDQVFAVSGSNLTGNITFNATTNYEISYLAGDDFNALNSISISSTNGVIQSTKIYVRLKSGLDKGVYSDELVLTSDGASSKTITFNGNVTDPPGIPYSQNFESFTSIAYLPDGWSVSDNNYLDDWGLGTSAGLRGNEQVLGYQNTSSSGTFTATLTLTNNSDSPLTEFYIYFKGRVSRLDQGRSPNWIVKVNDVEYNSLKYTTEKNYEQYHSAYVTGLNVDPGATYQITWSTLNGEGSGSNKQIGISDVNVLAQSNLFEIDDSADLLDADITTNAFINGNITVDQNLEIKNLFVTDNNALTISTESNLTLHGALFIGENASLNINSEQNRTGSLIINGSPSGDITVERYIVAANWASGNDGFHLISSPVTAEEISGEWTPTSSGNDYDLYGWSEGDQTWVNHKNTTEDPTWAAFHPSTNFNVGQGYLVAYQTTATKTFSGTLNIGDKEVTLTQSGTPAENNSYGYNLIGNPFTSALDWTHESWANENSNYGGVAKIWSGGAFIDVVTANPEVDDVTVIPAMNGFFVYTSTDNNIFTIPAAAQVHSSDNWHKSVDNNQAIKLTVKGVNSTLTQGSSVRFNPEATSGFDLAFDSYFMAGYAPMFYSVIEGKNFSTNTLPAYDSETTIPFVFVKNEYNDFELELTNSIQGQPIFLTDNKTGTIHKLSENPTYSFTASEGDNPNRFLLHFGAVGLDENTGENSIKAYSYNNTLYIQNSLEDANIRVIDLQGRLLLEKQFYGQGLQSLPLDFPTGVYVVQLLNSNTQKSVKVIVE